MKDPIKAFKQSSGLEIPAFPPNSRYYGLPTAEWTGADGRMVSYVTRRFIPPPENFAELQVHIIHEADRLDNLAARYLGDPESYWRLADSNGAVRPNALTETVGNELRITLPEGIPESTDD